MSASNFIGDIARLKDPNNLIGPVLDGNGEIKISAERHRVMLQEKVSQCMTKLFQKPGNGGNPFLFAFSGPKEHIIAGDDLKTGGGHKFKTAATDGKYFYWCPEFLDALEVHQMPTVMQHEINHILYGHCSAERSMGKSQDDWAIAIDYTDNATIELGWVKANEEAKTLSRTLPPLWGGVLGEPIPLAELLAWIDGKIDEIQGKNRIYSDPTLIDRGPESVYFEILQHKLNSPRRCQTCGALSLNPKTKKSVNGDPPYPPGHCPKCGSKPNSSGYKHMPMDGHMDPALSKQEIMGEMIQAAERAANFGRGYVPSEVETALAELKKPTLSPHDIIVHAMQRKAMDVGFNNDWSHFKRRPQYIYVQDQDGNFVPLQRLYEPRKYGHIPKWAALIDTSGSMSDSDIANGVKELQLVAAIQDSEGWAIPCDAAPHWQAKTQINNASDIRRTKIVGRGGTVFDDFFKELPREIGTDLDIVVIITDGDCGAESMPVALRPACDVLWIITNKRDFKPAFGRVVQLQPART